MQKRPRKSGFSLIEVMVALAVMGLGGYFLVSLLKNSMSLQRNVNSVEEMRSIMANIGSVLSDHQACKNTFLARSPSPTAFNVDRILNKNGDVVYQKYVGAGSPIYGNSTLRLMNVTVGGTGIDPRTNMARFVPSDTGMGVALVVVSWTKHGKEVSGPTEVERFFTMNVTLDGSGNISDCVANGGSLDQIWKRDTADPNNIYFSDGNVGVGTTSADAKLDVRGDLKIGFATNCGASNEGALRYNSTSKEMEYCNATAWKSLSPPPVVRQVSCMWVRVNNCEYNPCICPAGMYGAGLQVGIRAAGQWGANTWSQIYCCSP